MISLITSGRDDNYGENFLLRLKMSMENNCRLFKKHDIPFEYLLVEWNPFNPYLKNHPDFKDLFETYDVKDVIVKSSVVEKENLNQKVFYEYFAKNAGVRISKYDIILILNSDILIPEKSVILLKEILTNGLDDKIWYRLRYREQVDYALNSLRVEDIYYPQNPDGEICGYCSGDFLMLKKTSFITYGQGYDEATPFHRVTFQTGQDGEILWNMHRAGMKIKLVEGNYIHVNHGKPHAYDAHYNQNGYTNKPNWGFIDYNKIVNGNVIELE